MLATKLFFPMTDSDRGLSAAQIGKQIDASLARLRVDHVDLYQCHRHDPDTPLEETMQALTEVVRSGKARAIGFSEWPVEQIQRSLDMSGVQKFVSSQPQYSLLHRDPEHSVIPLCAAHGISQIVWSPLGQGVLTGKYKPGAPIPEDSRAASDTMNTAFRRHWLDSPTLEAVQALKPLADQVDLTLAQFALAWVLRDPRVAAAIIGATRPEQVDENVAALDTQVPAELFAQAEAIIGGI